MRSENQYVAELELKPRYVQFWSPYSFHTVPLTTEYLLPLQYSLFLWSIPFSVLKWKESEVAQSCPTLRDPMDCSLPGASVRGIFRREYWSGLPFPSPEDLPDPEIEPRAPALWAAALPSERLSSGKLMKRRVNWSSELQNRQIFLQQPPP